MVFFVDLVRFRTTAINASIDWSGFFVPLHVPKLRLDRARKHANTYGMEGMGIKGLDAA